MFVKLYLQMGLLPKVLIITQGSHHRNFLKLFEPEY